MLDPGVGELLAKGYAGLLISFIAINSDTISDTFSDRGAIPSNISY